MGKSNNRKQNQLLSKRNDNNNLAISKITAASFQGPLPPPQILDHYNQIVPGSAERIISLWENQVKHRQELEKKVISADINQAKIGSILGFIIAIAAICSGTFLAFIGRPTEGIAAILTALAGIIAAYGFGSYQRKKERDLKSKPPAPAE